MKPLGNIIQITDEPKKKIIFKVLLGQKRNLDYNPKDYYQSQKKNKKLFILEKPQNYINIKETKISNENNININVNIQNTKNTKNLVNIRIETTPVTAETNNNQKLNEIKNTEVNKIKNQTK